MYSVVIIMILIQYTNIGSGSIGTGLIIGSGAALSQGGPGGLLIGYIIMGWVCWVVLTALGEMSAYIPSKNGFAGHATRFIDPAAGVATGYAYLFKYYIVTPNQLNASALLISYWRPDLSGGIFVSVFFVFILLSVSGHCIKMEEKDIHRN